MGLFKKLKEMSGGVPKELLENGLLGRGVIMDVQSTNVAVGSEGFEERVCVFTIEVTLDNQSPYTATCRQAMPMVALAQMSPGQSIVAVRVDPNDQTHIAIDLSQEAPTVTLKREGTSAAEVLQTGKPVRVVIVETQPLGMKNPEGVDVHAFLLTVMPPGEVPYQAKVGNPVPPEAVPLLYPGSNLPAKVMVEQPQGVVIDWAAALAEFTKK